MTRYCVVYTKTNPGITWADTLESAIAKARCLEAGGYAISIWEQTEKGSLEIPFNCKNEVR